MKIFNLAVLTAVAGAPLPAEETREMDAHVHGVSTLEIGHRGQGS